MGSSKKTFKRLFNVIIALVIGYFVIYGLAAISKNSKGPLGGLLENMSDMVQDFERDNILEKREQNREKKLFFSDNISYYTYL